MLPSLEKLQKFFRLEAESGYQDRAVIGGLVKMLDFWEGEARNDGVPDEIIEAVVTRLRDYHSLTPQGRADALKGLWKRIQTISGEGAPEPAAQPPRPPVSKQREQPQGQVAPPVETSQAAPMEPPPPPQPSEHLRSTQSASEGAASVGYSGDLHRTQVQV